MRPLITASSLLRAAPLLLLPFLGTGCFWPHTTWRSQQINGKVLDERTHAPIEGVSVFLTAHPPVSCRTGADGSYLLKETRNWHWGYSFTPPETHDLPKQTIWWANITLCHSNYLSREINWGDHHPDVTFLRRVGEPSTPRPWLIFDGTGAVLQDAGAGAYLRPGEIQFLVPERQAGPTTIHIGFTRRVYDPQIKPLRQDLPRVLEGWKRTGSDWDFYLGYMGVTEAEKYWKGHSHSYRLEFTP